MFSICSELTPRTRILDTRIPQLMQPCCGYHSVVYTEPQLLQVFQDTEKYRNCIFCGTFFFLQNIAKLLQITAGITGVETRQKYYTK